MTMHSTRGLIGDTCFWIACFYPKDSNHKKAVALLEQIRKHVVLMPWPIMYEVLRTTTVSDRRMVAMFASILRRPKIIRIDDKPYRDICLDATLNQASVGKRGISLVDMVVRQIILEGEFRIERLLTFNAGDFFDV
jgi:predicted nucleic acid-binding protein